MLVLGSFMVNLQHINRFQAFGWHLLVSFGVAVLSTVLVFALWYPGELALASGVGEVFWLLLAVDVVLGPVITLIIFNPKKKALRWDLACVAAVQIGALLYGLNTVYSARPVYVVFNIDRFDLVFANDFSEEKLAKASRSEYQTLPRLGPEVIAARRPDDRKERNALLFSAISGGDDLPQLPQYYVAYHEQKDNAVKRSQALDELKKFNQDKASLIDQLIHDCAAKNIDAGFLPLKGHAADLTVIVDRGSGEVVDILDLMPWS